MASQQSSRPPNRRRSNQREPPRQESPGRESPRQEPPKREPPRERDMRVLLIMDVPRTYQWQDVKDEVKLYAPHLTVNEIEVPRSGLWSIAIRDKQKALEAYEGLKQKGFRGGVPIQLKLLHSNGERVIRPLVHSARPPPPRAPLIFPVPSSVSYLGPSEAHNYLQAPITYSPAYRHISSPSSMNNVMFSMQGLEIGPAPPPRPSHQPLSAYTTPARHQPSGSVDQLSTPAPRSIRARHTRADPLVCNGTVNRPSV